MKIIAFLPIKLNSQRLAHKNILTIAGHPLCWHLTNSLLNVPLINEVYVFCSDEDVIKYVPETAKFLKRDKYYDGDNVKSFELIGKFIDMVDADLYVFANTTSPFLKPESISNAIENILNQDYDSALTVQEFKTFARFRGEPINYDINDIPKTQDIEPVYVETSGFYMFKKEIFTEHHRRVGFNPYLQVVSDLEAVDIDTKEDFEFANSLYSVLLGKDE